MPARVALAVLAVTLAGCGLSAGGEAADVPADAGGGAPEHERFSALVSRPVPVSRLGHGPVVTSDLERVEQLRATLRAEPGQAGETLVALPGDVLFAFGEAVVTDAGRRTLAEVAELIVLEDPPAVRVEGHTDSVGTPADNQRLSERRAQAAAAVLTDDHGIDGSLLEVRGFGETRPVAPNTTDDGRDDPEGRTRNRRVEVVLADR